MGHCSVLFTTAEQNLAAAKLQAIFVYILPGGLCGLCVCTGEGFPV